MGKLFIIKVFFDLLKNYLYNIILGCGNGKHRNVNIENVFIFGTDSNLIDICKERD